MPQEFAEGISHQPLDFGHVLLFHMRSNGLTQKKLAEETGLCRDIIRKYIKNETTPSLEIAWKLSKHLGFSLDSLYYRHEDESKYRDGHPHKTKWDYASLQNAQNNGQYKYKNQQRMDRHWNKFKETFKRYLWYAYVEKTKLQPLRELMAIYIENQLSFAKLQSRSKEDMVFAKIERSLIHCGYTDNTEFLNEIMDYYHSLGYAKDKELLDGMMASIQKGAESLCETLSFALDHILVNTYAPIYATGNFMSDEELAQLFPDDLFNEPTNE